MSGALAQSARPDFSGVWTTFRGGGGTGFGAPSQTLPLTEEGQRRVDEYQASRRVSMAKTAAS